MKQKVLVVEDEPLVGTMVEMNLISDGYDVHWAKNGDEGISFISKYNFDAILLDISLPDNDGLFLLKKLRSDGVGTPVMMLTARSDISSKVDALNLGADDYLSKPFDIEELNARVRALVRRSQAFREIPSHRIIGFGRYQINLDTREATTNEGRIVLSEKESGLIELFVKAAGQTLTRPDILDEIWGMDSNPTSRTVDNLIMRLRKLFETDPENPEHIITVRGTGYRFQP